MTSVYERKEDCCGCTACMSVCPTQAITMVADEEGFAYPNIDQGLCIDCRLCVKVCPLVGDRAPSNCEQPTVYAAKHNDDRIRFNSSSGGMYTAISDYILNLDGIVYGAGFDDNFAVRHQRAETAGERDKFRGSKYVQSDLQGAFWEIKKELLGRRVVLFTGTPCQNAGLRSFLGEDFVNLYLCDIVCHGTPRPVVWKSYVEFCERKRKSKMKEYYFRFKGNGWHSHTEKAVYINGREDSTSPLSQSYKNLFHAHLPLRPACHDCKFCNFFRPSDITIADFWGIDKNMPEFDDNLGVSLVLINSPKGSKLFREISSDLDYRESNTKDCMQPNLHQPTGPSQHRDEFWHDYRNRDFGYVLKKYGGYGSCAQLRKRAVKLLTALGLLGTARRLLKR